MLTENNTLLRQTEAWTYRVSQPKPSAARLLLLLHGWTGDERSMWRYVKKLPEDYLMIAPRAPYDSKLEKGGYSWRDIKPGTWGAPTLDELRLAAENLVSLADFWLATAKLTSARFDVIGFSQGGALATTIAALYPHRVDRIAVLSGFVPPGVDELLHPNLLKGLRVFWAHGTKDEMISYQRGRASAKLLEKAGAAVSFCTADVEHRVGRECRYSLNEFFAQ